MSLPIKKTDVVCRDCGETIPSDSVFCPYCGSSNIGPEQLKCSKCGETIPEDSAFCPYCGESVTPHNAHRATAENKDGTRKTESSAFKGEKHLLNLCFCGRLFTILKVKRNGMGVMTNGFKIYQQ